MLKQLFKYLSFILAGLVGGMLWSTIILPYMAESPRFENLWFVQDFTSRQVNLYPRQEITIVENQALIKAAERVESSVVALQFRTTAATINASGLVLTTDGLVVTLADLIPKTANFDLYLNNRKISFEVVKKDIKENLALIKVDSDIALTACSFADINTIKKGQRVFVVGHAFQKETAQKAINQGVVKFFDNQLIVTNIYESETMRGSALFNIESQVIGVNMLGFDSEIIAIPINEVEKFAFSD